MIFKWVIHSGLARIYLDISRLQVNLILHTSFSSDIWALIHYLLKWRQFTASRLFISFPNIKIRIFLCKISWIARFCTTDSVINFRTLLFTDNSIVPWKLLYNFTSVSGVSLEKGFNVAKLCKISSKCLKFMKKPENAINIFPNINKS